MINPIHHIELIDAINSQNLNNVTAVIHRVEDINFDFSRALRNACYRSNLEIVKLLINHNAKITNLVIEWANDGGNTHIIKFINNIALKRKLQNI
jgi:predicted metallopeptidase